MNTTRHNQTQPDKKNRAYQGFRGLCRYEWTQLDNTRQATLSSHNPEVVGSSPIPAPIKNTVFQSKCGVFLYFFDALYSSILSTRRTRGAWRKFAAHDKIENHIILQKMSCRTWQLILISAVHLQCSPMLLHPPPSRYAHMYSVWYWRWNDPAVSIPIRYWFPHE